MPRGTLNLGILAHVDAGKTALTERLLHAAGVIDTIGSVDAGTTQTDTLALERQRGITIKSAVVSFEIAGVAVNLIDTPGHPDFIAEVERVLSLLDGAVLVISAIEGVQPQTRVLMRALRRLRVPTLLFVNKIDRRGADAGRVLAAIATARADRGRGRPRVHVRRLSPSAWGSTDPATDDGRPASPRGIPDIPDAAGCPGLRCRTRRGTASTERNGRRLHRLRRNAVVGTDCERNSMF